MNLLTQKSSSSIAGKGFVTSSQSFAKSLPRLLRYTGMVCLAAAAIWVSKPAHALTFQLPSNGDNVVGEVKVTQSRPGDTFSTVARRYDVGYYQLVEANPTINPKLPKVGTILVIPAKFVLPATPHNGIVVNLAELRLYYYPPKSNTVVTFPIGIGREGWLTPLGTTKIIQKIVNPTWYVPKSIYDWRAAQGVILPKSKPPGPENPLGGYAMRLGWPTYLIHGTNDASGVGRRSSSGCIRTMPEDIEALFDMVSVGTTVRVINDPYKIGTLQGKVYFEAHVPLEEQQNIYNGSIAPVVKLVNAVTKKNPVPINWDVVKRIAKVQNGVPQVINKSSSDPSDGLQSASVIDQPAADPSMMPSIHS